jgi:hypothetical protein
MRKEKAMSSKARKALSDACYAMFNFLKTQYGGYEEMAKALDKSKAALAEPLRNCDVGTAEEQAERFECFCVGFTNCKKCPVWNDGIMTSKCVAKWSQMPYESEVKE